MSNLLYDEITVNRIKLLHPSIRNQVKEWYLEINRKLPRGVRLRFSHTYRSNQEQDKLYNQRPKVTNAKGGQSIHNYGLAFDIVLLYDKDRNGTFETASYNEKLDIDKKNGAEWIQVVEYFKSKGLSWGGDFKSIYDSPHFEVKGYTWRDLQNKNTFIDGGIKYPVL